MLSVVIGLASAIIYGAADFLGGLASRRMNTIAVTLVVAVSGLGALALAYPVVGGVWSPDAALFGAISGVTGAIGISLLYACLAIGPMSILSPLTAVVSALVPVTVGLARGEQLTAVGWIALAVALAAVVLVGFVPEQGAVRPRPLALVMAVGAGAGIGAFLVLLELTPEDSGLIPLFYNRGVNALIMGTALVLVLLRRRATDGSGEARPRNGIRTGLAFAIAAGLVDAAANLGSLIALRLGDLAVTSVLIALYPAGTILLAAAVLRERIAPLQYVGLALALGASGLFALA
ncbi:EamA family transporter [Herbiconiux sp. SYSU D00978]|uniref:EamA family transporter n=1 Tax=Herbiconiux sp. SYSU D00978 TaxID=2812562 RepID=UPI001A962EE8|nr:EamA family transporter [Herbiconiux sp. SYSU D00978]